LAAPGGRPDGDRFRPLRSGGSTSSLINALLTLDAFYLLNSYFFLLTFVRALLIQENIVPPAREGLQSSLNEG
jgi:hypothetical protein